MSGRLASEWMDYEHLALSHATPDERFRQRQAFYSGSLVVFGVIAEIAGCERTDERERRLAALERELVAFFEMPKGERRA